MPIWGKILIWIGGVCAAGLVIWVVVYTAVFNSLDEGTITSKKYVPANSYITFVCASYNTNGTCTSQVPMTNHVPDRWCFQLSDGKDKTGSVSVDQTSYMEYNVGEYYPRKR